MIAALRRYLRQRQIEAARNEIKRLRELRLSALEREFAIRGRLALLEGGL